MHRTVAGANQVTDTHLGGMPRDREPPRWNLSTCTNCDGSLPAGSKPQTFCSDTCRTIATEIRDLRRQRAAGIDVSALLHTVDLDLRLRVESVIPIRGCDAEDWATFIRWFQEVDQA